MEQATKILKYVAAGLIAAAVVGLGVWYFFLQSKHTTIQNTDEGRGLSSATPSFSEPTGSTYQNVLSGITGETGTTNVPVQNGKPPQLSQLSKNPIAGMGFVKNGSATNVYFVERASGNIFSADAANGALTRLANTLMPKTYEAFFARDGSVIARSIDAGGRIATFAGSLPTSTPAQSSASSSAQSLGGTALEQNIATIAVNPTAREFFYLVVDPKSGLIGIRSTWNNAKPKRIFSSPLADWQIHWVSDGRIILAQSPSDNTAGYAYELKSDGTLTPLMRAVIGLTILPRASSTAILFGSSAQGSLTLYARLDEGSAAVRLPVKTIADKCVWASGKDLVAYCAVPQRAPVGDFLNNWYQGTLHTADAWWQINAKDGSAQILYTPSGNSASLDVERPQLDASGKYITFMNAVDKSLWLLRLDTNPVASSTPTH